MYRSVVKLDIRIQERTSKIVYIRYSTNIKFNDLIYIAISHTSYTWWPGSLGMNNLFSNFTFVVKEKEIFISPRFAVHSSYVEM